MKIQQLDQALRPPVFAGQLEIIRFLEDLRLIPTTAEGLGRSRTKTELREAQDAFLQRVSAESGFEYAEVKKSLSHRALEYLNPIIVQAGLRVLAQVQGLPEPEPIPGVPHDLGQWDPKSTPGRPIRALTGAEGALKTLQKTFGMPDL